MWIAALRRKRAANLEPRQIEANTAGARDSEAPSPANATKGPDAAFRIHLEQQAGRWSERSNHPTRKRRRTQRSISPSQLSDSESVSSKTPSANHLVENRAPATAPACHPARLTSACDPPLSDNQYNLPRQDPDRNAFCPPSSGARDTVPADST